MKRKLILIIAMAFLMMVMFAVAVSATEVDGIYYTFSSSNGVNTATVNSENVDCSLEIVNIPETVTYEGVTYTVTELVQNAFSGNNWPGNKKIKEVTVPSTVGKIGTHCFRNCTTLEKITIKAAGGEFSFTNAEFYGCTSLKTVDFSEAYGLRSMGQYLFTNCPLETVLLPEGLEEIASNVFSGQTKITEIKLPSTLKKISGKQAFSSTAFTSIVLPTGLTALGNNIFQASQLESIVIPASVQTVGEHCFNSTSKLKYVVIANPDVSGYNDRIFYSSAVDLVFFAGTEENAKTFAARLERATFTNFVSYNDYLANPNIDSYKDTIVYGTQNYECGNIKTNDAPTLKFTSYTEEMILGKTCEHCQRTEVVETIDAMFTFLGYSTAEFANGGISVGYNVNKEAVSKYEELTGEEVSYGLFAGTKAGLGTNDVIGENGEAVTGAITAGFKNSEYSYMFIKMFGFNEDNKDTLFAIGTYVEVSSEEGKSYSYLQADAPAEGAKYSFIKYSDFIKTA
ncbi:MAG: leucine-rich repeat domain-containing protein [Clostridia bacterium]|nr:leucine-rich repeat domain-containing protein [Clostridia bacterium]